MDLGIPLIKETHTLLGVHAGEMQSRLVGMGLSSEKLEPQGLYLLENGVDALIYIGKEAPQRVIQDLLGELSAPMSCWRPPNRTPPTFQLTLS